MDDATAAVMNALLVQSGLEREGIQETLLAAAQKERDFWRTRALKAERTLWLAQERLLSIFLDNEEEVYGD